MAALPSAEDAKLGNVDNALSAYNTCLELEWKSTTDENRTHSRILGYLILNAPSSAAVAEVARAIHSCAQDENKLLELGKCFLDWYIRPFRKFKGRTPVPTDHPSRPSFDRFKELLKEDIKEAPKDHTRAKAQALIRDGYKCAVTGIYDQAAYDAGVVDRSVGTLNTELAHILPESTYFDVSKPATGSSDKREYTASVLAVMSHFGYDVEKVNGPKVHSLYNIITMQHDVHDAFDRLDLWFESTGVPNQYLTKSTYNIFNLPRSVEFQSPDPNILAYPSRELLAFHATCAKVAHLSGAGVCIDKFDRDADELYVLASDGSSSALLTYLLSDPRFLVNTVA